MHYLTHEPTLGYAKMHNKKETTTFESRKKNSGRKKSSQVDGRTFRLIRSIHDDEADFPRVAMTLGDQIACSREAPRFEGT
jgi:hypothetical protein